MDPDRIAERMMEKWLSDLGSKSISAITPPWILTVMIVCGYSWSRIAGENSSYLITLNVILFIFGSTIFLLTSRKSAQLSWMNGGFLKSGRMAIVIVSVMFIINTVPLAKMIIESYQGPNIIINDINNVISKWKEAKDTAKNFSVERKRIYIEESKNKNNENEKMINLISINIKDISMDAKNPKKDQRCSFNNKLMDNMINIGFSECVTRDLYNTYKCSSLINGKEIVNKALDKSIDNYIKCVKGLAEKKFPITKDVDMEIEADKKMKYGIEKENNIIKIADEQIGIMKNLRENINDNKSLYMENGKMVSEMRLKLDESNKMWVNNVIESDLDFRGFPSDLPISSSMKITSMSGVLSFLAGFEIKNLPPLTMLGLLVGIAVEIMTAFLFTRYIQKVAPQMKKYDTLRYANDISDGNGPTGIRWLLLPALPPSA